MVSAIIKAVTQKYPAFYGRRETLRYKLWSIAEILFPRWWCGSCQRFTLTIERRRQNTAYTDSEANYITCCKECFTQSEENWQAMWDEYYGSRF